jgi:hypothetical protein
MDKKVARVVPVASDSGKSTEPVYDAIPKVPRAIVLGPSGSGKTQVLVNLITKFALDKHGNSIYSRIWIVSPSIDVDSTWQVVKDFVRDKLRIDERKEKWYWDKWDPEALHDAFQTQRRIIELQKQRKAKKYHACLLVLDDVADQPRITHSNKLIEMFMRGRHLHIHTYVSVQRYRVLDIGIRTQATDLLIFRLRSHADWQAIEEENDQVWGKHGLRKAYEIATEEPFSFLHLRLNAKDLKDWAWLRFERPLYDDVFPRSRGRIEDGS